MFIKLGLMYLNTEQIESVHERTNGLLVYTLGGRKHLLTEQAECERLLEAMYPQEVVLNTLPDHVGNEK